MIKADIVKAVARELAVRDKEALVIVDGILTSLKDVIREHRRLEIRDFGVFQVKTRKERVGRNPRNRTEYPIPACHVVTFRVGKELKLHSERDATAQGAAEDSPPASEV